MRYSDFFDFKEQALQEQERLQKNYCTWLDYQPGKGFRVRYCSHQEYLAELKSKGLLAKDNGG